MNASDIDESRLHHLGTEVAVSEIDRALHRFFSGEDSPPSSSEDSSTGIARASLLNLAIYTEDTSAVDRLSHVVEELTREMACRAILILADATGTPAVRSWVQAHCRLSDQGEKTVCTEQVSFLLEGADASLVRNAVFAHLDSDLPLVFWWQGELSDVFDERLYSRIDRLIFDSATWAQPSNQFLRLSRAFEESGSRFAIHDLAYTRSHPTRTAMALVFDDPIAFEALDQLSSIEIVYGPGQRLSALWMMAWIAGRLGARFEGRDANEDRFRFLWEGRRLSLIGREEKDEAEGKLEAIHAAHLDLGEGGAVEIKHDAECKFWRIRWDLAGCSEREKLYPGLTRSDADLAAEILKRAGRNRAMVEAFPLLRELVVA